MSHANTLFPVDHWTTGIEGRDLRGLVERHKVFFEVLSDHGAGPDQALVRRGWTVDLYGRRSASDAALKMHEAGEHIHDVLHAVATACLPQADNVSVALTPYTGAVHLNQKEDVEEVRLRVLVHPRDASNDGGVGAMEHLTKSLEALGAHRRA